MSADRVETRPAGRTAAVGSMDRAVIAATIAVAAPLVATKAVVFVKEFVVAARFGVNDDLDAFLLASTISMFVVTVAGASLRAVLLPAYVALREQQGPAAAEALQRNALAFGLVVFGALAGVVALTAPWTVPVLASGFEPSKQDTAIFLTQIIAPIIVIQGLTETWSAIAHGHDIYARVAIAPMVTTLAIVVAVLTLPDAGGTALAVGLVAGTCLEAIVVARGVQRRGFLRAPRTSNRSLDLYVMLRQYRVVAFGAMLTGLNQLVDQAMAASLDAGSVSSLGYANRLVALPLSVATVVVASVGAPLTARLVAQGQLVLLQKVISRYLVWIFVLLSVAALALVLGASTAIGLLERGEFTAQDTALVADLVQLAALQLPFFVAAILLVRTVNSLQINRIALQVSVLTLVANIIGNVVLIELMGIRGIALSTSAVAVLSFAYLFFHTRRHVGAAAQSGVT